MVPATLGRMEVGCGCISTDSLLTDMGLITNFVWSIPASWDPCGPKPGTRVLFTE